jgi:RNA polymerase sigma factor (sigma-70 family)
MREKNLTMLDNDTLIAAGMLGYVQCLNRYDPNRGAKFKTYAEYRIKGAVLDEVRKMIGDERCKTPRPRQVNYDYTLIGDDNVTQRDMESAIDLEQFFKFAPLDQREEKILRCRMTGMNLREISKKFGFSESRASQLLAKIKREVYIYYRGEMNFNFKLTTHDCPSCDGENCVGDNIEIFKCDTCDADLRIVDGIPILAVTEDISGEEIK